jgi:hypothetical protein
MQIDQQDNDTIYRKSICIEYNTDKIFQDIIKTQYVKSYDSYNLKYHEYVFGDSSSSFRRRSSSSTSSCEYFIFNSLTFTFTPVDELISDKILTYDSKGGRLVYIKSIVNTDLVDDILNSLISSSIKLQYKKLVYNLIVAQEEKQIIFYDYNCCLLTTWIKDLLYTISGSNACVYSSEYYDNKIEFKKLLKSKKPRCVIIDDKRISTEKQIDDFHKLGFRIIIIRRKDETNTMYNIMNFRKYLQDNKDVLMKCIKEENDYETTNWDSEIQHDDCIFYTQRLLLTNFLKWCCTK